MLSELKISFQTTGVFFQGNGAGFPSCKHLMTRSELFQLLPGLLLVRVRNPPGDGAKEFTNFSSC